MPEDVVETEFTVLARRKAQLGLDLPQIINCTEN
jgi:hypothetical protein